jgi:hypothetical protein
MRSYFAVAGNIVFSGGYLACLRWSRELVHRNHTRIVKIVVAHPDEKLAKIVAEITSDQERWIAYGRTLPTKRLRRAANG